MYKHITNATNTKHLNKLAAQQLSNVYCYYFFLLSLFMFLLEASPCIHGCFVASITVHRRNGLPYHTVLSYCARCTPRSLPRCLSTRFHYWFTRGCYLCSYLPVIYQYFTKGLLVIYKGWLVRTVIISRAHLGSKSRLIKSLKDSLDASQIGPLSLNFAAIIDCSKNRLSQSHTVRSVSCSLLNWRALKVAQLRKQP